MTKFKTACLIFIIIFLSYLPGSYAAFWHVCGSNGKNLVWNGDVSTMHISNTSFPIGSTPDELIKSTMSRWNSVVGSNLEFLVARDEDDTWSKENGKNEIVWSDTATLDNDALAVTYWRYTNFLGFCWFSESDIAFNLDYNWSYIATGNTNDVVNGRYSFEGVALHEFGHALGLDHEDRWLSTMNSIYPGAGIASNDDYWEPAPDSKNGARILYGNSDSEIDIAASAFTKIDEVSNSRLVDPPNDFWKLQLGASTTFSYTVLNSGTERVDYDTTFYLSDDSEITSDDLFIMNFFGGFISANNQATYTIELNIPFAPGLAPGSYYLGVIVDPENLVEESDESNNNVANPQAVEILVSDFDGDNIPDHIDIFPFDPTEWADTDGDSIGNNSDVFPNDPTEWADTDGDGVGDNSDVFPNDPTEWLDSDYDGVGDNSDAFPNDPGETLDSDGDGVGDNSDQFPSNPDETVDTDGDGVGDNGDVFPNDPDETLDSDGDGVGDNADVFPLNSSEWIDSDGDGVGDNSDAFPNDPTKSTVPSRSGGGTLNLITTFFVALLVLKRKKTNVKKPKQSQYRRISNES